MFALAIFISYNIQFYVPTAILWPKIRHRLKNEFLQKYGEYPFRIVLVLVTCEYTLYILIIISYPVVPFRTQGFYQAY